VNTSYHNAEDFIPNIHCLEHLKSDVHEVK